MKKAKGKTAATATAPMVGAQEFRRSVYTAVWEWSVWAVEAPIDAVTAALVEVTGGEVWSKDILDEPRAANGADVGKMIPIVSVKGGTWVVGYRTVGFYMSKEADMANEQAAELSRRLKARAVAYHSEAVSGWAGYELFERGRSAGQVGGDDLPEDFPDPAFQELGLVVPACALAVPPPAGLNIVLPAALDKHKGKVWLDVSAFSKKIIDRAYVIDEADPGNSRAARKGDGAGPRGDAGRPRRRT
jgi:hypothetical protein